MSRTWSTCSIETRCGSCGKTISLGQPQQEITVHPSRGLKRRPFLRCQQCADGEPPNDLPPSVANRAEPVQPRKLLKAGPGALPFDYRTAAAGGEEQA